MRVGVKWESIPAFAGSEIWAPAGLVRNDRAEAAGNWISQLFARALPWPRSGSYSGLFCFSAISPLPFLSTALPSSSQPTRFSRESNFPRTQPGTSLAPLPTPATGRHARIHSCRFQAALPKAGETAPSPQALRPALQALTGAGGSPPSHMVEKNKEFGHTSLRLSPDTVAYSRCGPGWGGEGALSLS